MNWASVTDAGTKITVPRSTVSLTVPQGAVSTNVVSQDMYVAVLGQDKYKPQLDSSQTGVTPVVMCGPVNITHCLQKPVVISLPHVGGSSVKRMLVLYCADLDHEEAEWEIVHGMMSEQQQQDNQIYMQVDSTMVHLVTERLGAYVLVANLTDLNQIGGGGIKPSDSMPRMSIAPSSSGCSSLGSQIPAQSPEVVQKLSPSTKAALCRTLDVPSIEGNGWQQLAESLGAEHYVQFFATQPSPSEALLNLWEARNRDPEPLKNLSQLLRDIRREDANVILERDLK